MEIVVLVLRARSGELRAGWRSPSLVLSRGQRRRLPRQIRGRADVDPILLPVTRQLAGLLARQRSLIALWVVLPLVLVGQAVTSNSAIRWTSAVAFIAPYAGMAVQTLRDSRRAEQFLTRHPERRRPVEGSAPLVPFAWPGSGRSYPRRGVSEPRRP